jgi:hypothetical protein
MKKFASYTANRISRFIAMHGIAILTLFVLFSGFTPAFTPGNTYRIGDKSSLNMEVKTNVNVITCRCNDSFPMQAYYVEKLDDEHCSMIFRGTKLNMRVKSMDCGNKMMNKDMYDALNAETFPNIRIELLQVIEERCTKLHAEQEWAEVTAFTRITLNGKTNDCLMEVLAKKTGHNAFRFVGSKVIHMSDFNILPPKAALGMVKAMDEIKINIDLEVMVE